MKKFTFSYSTSQDGRLRFRVFEGETTPLMADVVEPLTALQVLDAAVTKEMFPKGTPDCNQVEVYEWDGDAAVATKTTTKHIHDKFFPWNPVQREGWYVLNQDVANPLPDKRSRGLSSVPVWKKGTQVEVKFNHARADVLASHFGNTPPGYVVARHGYVLFADNETITFNLEAAGGKSRWSKVECHGNEILNSLDFVPENLGQYLRNSGSPRASWILAKMIEDGTLTFEQIKAAGQAVNDMDQDDTTTNVDAVLDKHWVNY